MVEPKHVVLVTGASRGLGHHLALALASFGMHVVGIARSEAELRQLEEEARGLPGAVEVLTVDVADARAVERLRRTLVERGTEPTAVVNAAGVFGPLARVWESDPIAWAAALNVNTLGPFLTARAFVPAMVAAGYGRIVNVSSAATHGEPAGFNSAYLTSKSALNALTRSLAAELEGSGVTVNAIHPGELKTEMWQGLRAAARAAGAEPYVAWADLVEQTGGDDPARAVDLVRRLLDPGCTENGRFLWIDGGLQPPLPTW